MEKKSKVSKVKGVTEGAFALLVEKVTELSKIVEDNRKELLDKINSLSNHEPEVKITVPPTEKEEAVLVGDIPKEWRSLTDTILGKDFDIKVEYPESGTGFRFSLVIPADKSNADKNYLGNRPDIRTKTIQLSEGSAGVEAFCRLVAKNLKINNEK